MSLNAQEIVRLNGELGAHGKALLFEQIGSVHGPRKGLPPDPNMEQRRNQAEQAIEQLRQKARQEDESKVAQIMAGLDKLDEETRESTISILAGEPAEVAEAAPTETSPKGAKAKK